MKVVKLPNGNWYIIGKLIENGFEFKVGKAKTGQAYITIGKATISVPKQFIGKKVRLKVELVKK